MRKNMDSDTMRKVLEELLSSPFGKDHIDYIKNDDIEKIDENSVVGQIVIKKGVKFKAFVKYCKNNKSEIEKMCDDILNGRDDEMQEPELTDEEDEQETVEEETSVKEKLSQKGQKLYGKVTALCDRIQGEKNPLKLQLLKFKVRMLQAKIQRELDLINARDQYNQDRENLENQYKENDNKKVDEIAKIADQIHLKKQMLRSNSESDPKSPDFIYEKDIIQRQGGLENLVKTLQKSDDPNVKSTGNRIDAMMQARKELEDLQKQYKEIKNSQKNLKSKYEADTKELNSKEKRLTLAEKYNIFLRIGDFFKTVGKGIKDIHTKITDTRAINSQLKNAEKMARDNYKNAINTLKENAAQAKAEHADTRKTDFLKEVKLKGKSLEEANEPAQVDEPTQPEGQPEQWDEPPAGAHATDDDVQGL